MLKMSELNINMSGQEDWASLSETDKNEKIKMGTIYHDAYCGLTDRKVFNRAENKIVIFTGIGTAILAFVLLLLDVFFDHASYVYFQLIGIIHFIIAMILICVPSILIWEDGKKANTAIKSRLGKISLFIFIAIASFIVICICGIKVWGIVFHSYPNQCSNMGGVNC